MSKKFVGTVDLGRISIDEESVEPVINLQEKEITITENTTTVVEPDTGYDGLSSVSITTDVEATGGLDFTDYGYDYTPSFVEKQLDIMDNIMENWNASLTDAPTWGDVVSPYSISDIVILPEVDTSNVTDLFGYFYDLRTASIVDLPVFDFSSVTSIDTCYSDFGNLSDKSIDNILQTCLTMTSYTGTKQLSLLGVNSKYKTACENAPHYSEFTQAGWSLGF